MAEGRRILTHTPKGRRDVQELLHGLFVAELIQPSDELWIVSPWISNIIVINDQAGRLRFLHDSGQTRVRLLSAIGALARLGGTIHIVTRPTDNEAFVASVKSLRQSVGDSVRLCFRQTLHAKGIAGDGYAVTGSMNLTWSGTEKWDELVEFRTGNDATQIRSKFREAYGDAN